MQPEVMAFMFFIILVVIKAIVMEIEYWKDRDTMDEDEEIKE